MNHMDDKFLEQWTNITFPLPLETQCYSTFVKMEQWVEYWFLYGLSNLTL